MCSTEALEVHASTVGKVVIEHQNALEMVIDLCCQSSCCYSTISTWQVEGGHSYLGHGLLPAVCVAKDLQFRWKPLWRTVMSSSTDPLQDSQSLAYSGGIIILSFSHNFWVDNRKKCMYWLFDNIQLVFKGFLEFVIFVEIDGKILMFTCKRWIEATHFARMLFFFRCCCSSLAFSEACLGLDE